MKSIEIGKAIIGILSKNKDIEKIVKGKAYPLIADSGTTFPFILYRRASVDPAESKDSLICSEYAYVELMVVTDVYEQGVNLASMIDTALKGVKGTFQNIPIISIKCTDSSEDYISGSYVQYLKLKIKVQ